MESSDIARHQESVRAFAKPGGPLSVDAPTATIKNPHWWIGGMPTPERASLHTRLLEEWRESVSPVEQGRRAIVLAGPPGAGKSTRLAALLGDEMPTYRRIDADDFKTALLAQARTDGSYESWLIPPEVRDRIKGGEQFFPLELASLVHAESSYLARIARDHAITQGDNVVIDTVLGSQSSAEQVGRVLETGGYDIVVLDVEVPFEVSEASIRDRWAQSYRSALEGAGDGLGGRWVPSEYARGIFDGPGDQTRSEVAAKYLAETCQSVRVYQQVRFGMRREGGSVVRGEPRVTILSRTTPGAALLPDHRSM